MRLLRGKAATQRSLALTVTTTNCDNPREDPYKGRFEISYDYLVEYSGNNNTTPNTDPLAPTLIGIGNAIAYGLAGVLDKCDYKQRPAYAVELASWHEVLESGYCEPKNQGSTCQVIRGVTAIRSDTAIVGTIVEDRAYEAIKGVFYEPVFLNQFVPTAFDRIDFGRIVEGSVGGKDDASAGRGSVSTVPIIVAIVTALALVFTFIAGWAWRNRGHRLRTTKQPKGQSGGVMKTSTFLLGSAPPKYYELDEEPDSGGGSSTGVVKDILAGYENVSMTWSISDITSESGSILSNLSRTTSKLERIEEGDDEGSHEEWDCDDTEDQLNRTHHEIPPECLYCMDAADLKRIDLFPVTDTAGSLTEANTSELEGCRYLEDHPHQQELGIEILSSTEDLTDSAMIPAANSMVEEHVSAVLVSEEDTVPEKPEPEEVDESAIESDKSEHRDSEGRSGCQHSLNTSSSSLGADESSISAHEDSELSADTSTTSSISHDEQQQHPGDNTTADLSMLLASTNTSASSSEMQLVHQSQDTDGGAADDEHSVSTCNSSDFTRETSNETSTVLRGVDLSVLQLARKEKEEASS